MICSHFYCTYYTISFPSTLTLISTNWGSRKYLNVPAKRAKGPSPLALPANPIVYHLTSNDPWRASIAISDATNLNNLGYNVTLLLSIEGVQVGGVKNPHHFLNLDNVVANVSNFIKDGGKVVVCGVCLRVAGFEPNEIIDGAIIGTDEITPKLFTNATVVTY
jgi:predicted peroxiredoxin